MQQPAAGAGTRTPQPSTGQLWDRIDMQQAARGTGMQRSRAHQQQRGSIDMQQPAAGAGMQRQPSSPHEGDSSGANLNDPARKKHKRRQNKRSTIHQPAMTQQSTSNDVHAQDRPSTNITNPLWHGVLDSELLDTASIDVNPGAAPAKQSTNRRPRRKTPTWTHSSTRDKVGRRRSPHDP